MRKITLFGLGICLLFVAKINTASGQEQTGIENSPLYRLFQMKYIFAMKYNDNQVAKDALYSMLSMDPGDDSLKIRLCYHYFENSQFPSSLFVSEDLLSINPDNIDALRMNAISYERMGVMDKAVASFETLYMKTNEIGILYETALMQFELERYEECKTNLSIVIKNPQAKVLKVNFATDDNNEQEVILEAAALNAFGMAEKMQGNTEEAKKIFNNALQIQPDFILAKQNLESL